MNTQTNNNNDNTGSFPLKFPMSHLREMASSAGPSPNPLPPRPMRVPAAPALPGNPASCALRDVYAGCNLCDLRHGGCSPGWLTEETLWRISSVKIILSKLHWAHFSGPAQLPDDPFSTA